MPKKPRIVWVGTTPVTPLTSKVRKQLHKLRKNWKKRLDLRRRKYPEVRGRVVDYTSHSIDDGILCMKVCFKDKTIFSLRFACDMFIPEQVQMDLRPATGMAHPCLSVAINDACDFGSETFNVTMLNIRLPRWADAEYSRRSDRIAAKYTHRNGSTGA